MELPETNRNRDKVCWTRDNNTSQEPNGWLEEKLSVAVVQQVNELDDTTAFLEAELADFSTMTGTSNMAEHQIKTKDHKPLKQRYYPKNPKIKGEINAKVDELLQIGFIEHSKSPYSSPIVKDGYWQIPMEENSRLYTAIHGTR